MVGKAVGHILARRMDVLAPESVLQLLQTHMIFFLSRMTQGSMIAKYDGWGELVWIFILLCCYTLRHQQYSAETSFPTFFSFLLAKRKFGFFLSSL
jgi:hypothetical protein